MNNILAIKVDGRTSNAVQVQEILTKFGCNIKARVGFHEAGADHCAMDGIIILQLFGDDDIAEGMRKELDKLDGVSPRMIEF
ncbi:MAG: hypothetical protein PHT29_00900 [Eubacteriales bacterium]|nr:hypothetical protein [Eubacteriales bacterium]MDD3289436.1 hypothetical protein [Eubacteriales bacterium]MDD3863597.1 hypothetical protein [Eubacteriales bacterium]MDD4444404.1 hypothetical protein [Eubacteriales bacterium]